MTPNGNAPQPIPPTKRHGNWPLIILAALFIIVPFLTWYGIWFGRNLSDEKIAEYLSDDKNPRHIQHALAQLETRIEKGDATVKKFYPQIVSLTTSPHAEIRKTVAWVMGQDNTSDEFHQALLKLLNDPEPLVRRNAALQLVRFADASGRPELRAMLQAFEVKSPVAGTIVSILGVGSNIRAGALLARIRDTSKTVQEFRAPVDGTLSMPVVAKEGDAVTANQSIAWFAPDHATIDDALRGLAYVGTQDDLPLIESCARTYGSGDTASEAAAAVKAIQARNPQ